MKKLLLCVSTALLAMLAGCSEGIGGGGDFLTNLSGNNKIYYTSTDGEKIFPMVVSGEADAVLLSNTYKNGRGCMTFDEDVTKISGLFNGEDRLVSVELPNSLTEIGWRSFAECTNLVEITIPKKVSIVSPDAFEGCTSLPVENGIRYADNFLVEVVEKDIDSYTIKNDTKWIGDNAFQNCSSLASITIPDSVTSIGDYAFCDCSSLASITIPDSVSSIGESAFAYCESLESIIIPDSVTSIGEHAFFYCSSLAKVYCKPTTPPTGDSDMFNLNASGRKIYVPTDSVDAYKTANYWSDYKSYIYGYDF